MNVLLLQRYLWSGCAVMVVSTLLFEAGRWFQPSLFDREVGFVFAALATLCAVLAILLDHYVR